MLEGERKDWLAWKPSSLIRMLTHALCTVSVIIGCPENTPHQIEYTSSQTCRPSPATNFLESAEEVITRVGSEIERVYDFSGHVVDKHFT